MALRRPGHADQESASIDAPLGEGRTVLVRQKTCRWFPSVNGYFHRFRRWAQILILEIRQCIPVVKIIARLELDETISFPDGH